MRAKTDPPGVDGPAEAIRALGRDPEGAGAGVAAVVEAGLELGAAVGRGVGAAVRGAPRGAPAGEVAVVAWSCACRVVT